MSAEELKPHLIAVVDEKGEARLMKDVNDPAFPLLITHSIEELLAVLQKTPCCGLLVDIRMKIKASAEQNSMFQTISNHFPLLMLRWNLATQGYNTFSPNQEGDMTVGDFILGPCSSTPPRCLRLHERKSVHLSCVFFPPTGKSKDDWLRSSLLDLSVGGCFAYSTTTWARGSKMKLVFPDMEDRTPVIVEVMRNIPWGKGRQLPGMGLRFEKISEAQMECILSCLKGTL